MNSESDKPGDAPLHKLVVLDRDGVINQDSTEFIKSPDEWHPIPGSLAAIAELGAAGFTVVVATNQSGVGRGLFSVAILDDIHKEMLRQVDAAGGHIDQLFVCPHAPDDGCDCRKPAPGLMRQIERHYAQSLHGVPVVGDSERDMQAAIAVGARPVLVRTGNGKVTEKSMGKGTVSHVFDSLADAVAALINGTGT